MSQVWQQYEFGGDVNEQPVDLQARNRLEILDAGARLTRDLSAAAQVLFRA